MVGDTEARVSEVACRKLRCEMVGRVPVRAFPPPGHLWSPRWGEGPKAPTAGQLGGCGCGGSAVGAVPLSSRVPMVTSTFRNLGLMAPAPRSRWPLILLGVGALGVAGYFVYRKRQSQGVV